VEEIVVVLVDKVVCFQKKAAVENIEGLVQTMCYGVEYQLKFVTEMLVDVGMRMESTN